MTAIDLEHLRSWIGRTHCDEDHIAARHARLMAATVDHPGAAGIRDGARLPALWHWLYFLDALPAGELGRDGHPARGGFLPPVPLPNRMWAGGRVSFLAPLTIGATVRKESTVQSVEHKRGRAGELVFVTVRHELKSLAGELLLREEHDIAYKGATPAPPAATAATPEADAPFTRTLVPTSTLLFRYSALCFNGHRIHYDADYCREVEGYPNLVIHGPLLATLLANFAEETGGKPLREFSYRALRPALLGDAITLHADVLGARIALFATLGDGAPCMRAEARVA